MEILAIIPARGGSKGLPGKNLRKINGHPLISYSILAGHLIKSINRVIVSTEDEEIAKVAKQYDAEIPFMRPNELAKDTTTDFEVFYYTLHKLFKNEQYYPDFVIQLRPTSPIRFVQDIENCIELMKNNACADSLRIVTSAPISPYKMWTINKQDTFLKSLLNIKGVKEPYNAPRQNLPEVFWQVGTLDIIRTSVIMKHKSMSGTNILPYIIDNKYAIDIDNIGDFNKAFDVINSYNCIKHEKSI